MTNATNGSDVTIDEFLGTGHGRPCRAIGYIRVSSLREIRRQRGEISTEARRAHIAAFAEREGIAVVDWVEDLNVSGRREQFLNRKIASTIARISAGEADCVVVYHVSRWGRSSIENQLSEAALREAGGRLLSATEPNDEHTTSGRFTRQQLYAMAEYQSNLIRDSWIEAHRSRLRRQLPRDGRPRLGYRYLRDAAGARYEPDPVAGPLLTEAFRRVIAGEALWTVARDLGGRGLRMAN